MNMDSQLSRSIRAAAQLTRLSEDSVENLFKSSRVLVRLEDSFIDNPDARGTFILTVNQCLRFCPNVAISLSSSATELLNECNKLAEGVHGEGHSVLLDPSNHNFRRYNAIVNVGTGVIPGLPWTTVNSSGWVGRVSTSESNHSALLWNRAAPNPIGALAAACLGSSQAFLYLLNEPRISGPFEISLFNHEIGAPGSLNIGPKLPMRPVHIDAFLVGCGAVSNGWAYTLNRLPVIGHIRAIDRQRLGEENVGPYVAVDRRSVSKPKAEIIGDLLNPQIAVTPYVDEWEQFKIRLKYEVTVPPLIIAGLDNVETRHSIQQLWPECLIDMGANSLTSQVIVKPRCTKGICLLEALKPDVNELSYAERLSNGTGLSIDRIISSPTAVITEEDVASAPAQFRDELERAWKRGERICGRIVRYNLDEDNSNSAQFAPAVPFVTAFSGVVGAAETMKLLTGHTTPEPVHLQYSFESGRARALEMLCASDCECSVHAA